MPQNLATKDPAARRLILACYAAQHPDVHQAVYARLRDQGWSPTPEDCPVPWATLERWYGGLQKTGQLVMNSY